MGAIGILVGAIIVALTVYDVLSTLVITGTSRPSVMRLSRHVFSLGWRMVGSWRRRQLHGRQREQTLRVFFPGTLLTMLALWLSALVLGWAAIDWGLDRWLGTFGRKLTADQALYQSGSALLTLGVAIADKVSSTPARVLTFAEAFTGLLTDALFISFLPTLYAAHTRREALVAGLHAEPGSETTAERLIREWTPEGKLTRLEELFTEWRIGVADIEQSHVAYPILVYVRSAQWNQSWILALGIILEAACIMAACVPDSRAQGAPARRLQMTGARALRALTRRLGLSQGAARSDALDAEFELVYKALQKRAVVVDSNFDSARGRCRELFNAYGHDLAALRQYLVTSSLGYWQQDEEGAPQ